MFYVINLNFNFVVIGVPSCLIHKFPTCAY